MKEVIKNGNFRSIFFGRVVTNVGDSLYVFAAMWLVYEFTGSSFYTGVAGFLIQGPIVTRFLVGPLADRWPVRRTLVSAQIINGLLVLAVPLAVAAGFLSVWIVLLVLPLASLVNQFVYPAQNAALPRIVEDENLVRANSLFSMSNLSVNMVATAAGGVILSIVGAISLFVLNSITFFIAAALFLGLRIPGSIDDVDSDSGGTPMDAKSDRGSIWQSYRDDLFDGFRYIRGSLLISIYAGVVIANFTAGAQFAILPSFADLLGGPRYYGLLMSASAAGTLFGTLTASFVEHVPYGRIATVGLVLHGSLLALSIAVPSTTLTMVLFFISFLPIGTFNVSTVSILQSAVDDDFVARVTSSLNSLGFAAMPVGSLVGGTVGDVVSAETVLYGVAGVVLVVGVYFLVRPQIRRLPAVENLDESTLGLGV